MLLRQRIQEALESRRTQFLEGAERAEAIGQEYREALERVMRLSSIDVLAAIGGVEWPGALPTSEWDRGAILPFGHSWDDHEAAAAWAMEAIAGATTVAVDGSQIAPSKEFGVPVSLVQVSWFENRHDPERPYVKDVRNEVLAPGDGGESVEEYAFAESRLNQSRFVMEMQVATERIGRLDPDPVPLVFLDGALVLSFAGRMAPPTRNVYLDSLFGVLSASERHRVPVVGYIDTSYASDLATLVRTAMDLETPAPPDGVLLTDRMDVFARTAACRCARGDVLPHYRRGDDDRSADIYFTYLQIGPARPPARIEFPGWILEAGLLDRVMDLIRAEIVAGRGYPYALETADAAAVLTREDRMAFYRQYHQFAAEIALDRPLPGKSVSKAYRR